MDRCRIVLALLIASALLSQRTITQSTKVVTGPVTFLNLPYNGYIAGDAAVGSPVHRVNSEGNLVPLVAQISNAPEKTRHFSLQGTGSEFEKFQIDDNAGNVTLKTAYPTVNTTTTFTVFGIRRGVVGVSDHAFNVTQLTVNVVVRLNKHSPRFSNASYSGNITYGAATGHVILTVNATDADNGTSGEVMYSIESGDDAGLFNLGGKSGVLALKKKIPDKSVRQYSLVVKANDKGVPVRSGTASVLVQIHVPTTAAPTTSLRATTSGPTTVAQTTAAETARPSTTSVPTTTLPTTPPQTTRPMTTEGVSTARRTTAAATTRSTTESVTSESPTTEGVTTEEPTTLAVTTPVLIKTTEVVTSKAPVTTASPTAEGATTKLVTTEGTTTLAPTTSRTSPYSTTRAHPPVTTSVTTGVLTTESVTTKLATTEGATTLAPTTSRTTPYSTTRAQTTAPVTSGVLTTESVTTKLATTEGTTTTPAPTTSKTTPYSTTRAQTTAPITSGVLTTESVTTKLATTEGATTEGTTTPEPTTSKTTPYSTTRAQTTAPPVTTVVTTGVLTTESVTTASAATEAFTTENPTTLFSPTKSTTMLVTSKIPRTTVATTMKFTTAPPSTPKKTTEAPSTQAASTLVPTTEALTTAAASTSNSGPSTKGGPTLSPSTQLPVTTATSSGEEATTLSSSTYLPTTEASSTNGATTTQLPSTTAAPPTGRATTTSSFTQMRTTAEPTTGTPSAVAQPTEPNTTVQNRSLSTTNDTRTGKTTPTTNGGYLVVNPTRHGSAKATTQRPVSTQPTIRVASQEDTSVDALPPWALVLIPINFVIVVLGFALLVFFKCRKRLRREDESDQHMKGKPNSFLDGWLTTQLDYLSRASREGPAPHDEYEQHTPFFGEPWEMHNRVRDVEIEQGYSNGPSRRSSARSGRTPSRKNSRRDSNRSQGRGSSVQYARDDEQLEYVGEWSEVIGSRLTDDTMTSPPSGSPSSGLWQDNSLYVPTESTPLGSGMESHMRPNFSGAYSNMMSQEEPLDSYPATGVQYGSDYDATSDQSKIPDAWQEFEYRPTLTRIVEEPDEETTGESRPRKLAFISGTASDRRSKRSQPVPFTPSADYLDDYESSTDLSDATESGDSEDRRNPYYARTQSTPPCAQDESSSSFGVGSNGTSNSERELRSRKDSRLVADALTWQPPMKKLSLREALDSWHAGQDEDCSHL